MVVMYLIATAVRPWLVEGELYNGRVAMMAAAGVLFTEAVGRGPWWTAPERVCTFTDTAGIC
jgi:hypothetical protein